MNNRRKMLLFRFEQTLTVLLTVMLTTTYSADEKSDQRGKSPKRGRGRNKGKGKWWGVANHLGPGDAYKESPPFRGAATPVNPNGNPIKRPINPPRPPGNALRPRNPQLGGNNNHRGYPGSDSSGYHYGRPTDGRGLYLDPSTQPLNRKQLRLVKKNSGTLLAIVKGAKIAIDECKFQFKNRRWNCQTDEVTSRGGLVFGKILRIGCRETAFIYAITAGGVSHAVARGCSEGIIDTCTCEYNKSPSGSDWEWGGCSDNVDYGYRFGKEFVDAVEKGKDLRYLTNLHNNEAGRWHANNRAFMRRECKCHGMSGSCTVKTCWTRLPHFRTVGDNMKERFDGASRITTGNSGSSTRGQNGATTFQPFNPTHKTPQMKDLVYFERSPDFCEKSSYSAGTKGRFCNATSLGVDGCDLMCCGRGYESDKQIVEERCNCTFHWCCEVKCQKCRVVKTIYTCL